MKLKKFLTVVGTPLLGLLLFTGSAHAAIDLSAITGAFTAEDVTVAVLAVAGVLATIYATMTAAKMALRWIRNA